MLSSQRNWMSILISMVCCCHLFAKLMPVIPDITIPQVQETVIEGQAGWIFCNVSGSGGSQGEFFTGGDDVSGNAGVIDNRPAPRQPGGGLLEKTMHGALDLTAIFDEVGKHQDKDVFLRENKKSLT